MENTYRISDVIDRRFLKLPLSTLTTKYCNCFKSIIYILLLLRHTYVFNFP